MARDKTTEEICEIHDVERKTVQQWQKKGLPFTKSKSNKPNMFDAGEVAAFLRDNGLTGEIGRPTGPMSDQMAAAKLRKLNADADIYEMNRDQKKGLLVEKSENEKANTTKFTVIRNKLMAMPSAVAPSIVGLDAPEIEREIEQRIREILTELSRK
jgi:phage terminase Nu1 subunit (DNA packaging protein)